MNKQIEKILKEIKESEKLLNKPIRRYKEVKDIYNDKALKEIKEQSTREIQAIRDKAIDKALKELDELERQVTEQGESKELSETDLITLIYLVENTEDEEELKELYRENLSNENFKMIFKTAMKKKSKQGLAELVEAEQVPKELEQIERAKAIVKGLGIDKNAYAFIEVDKLLSDKLGGLDYKTIDRELLG